MSKAHRDVVGMAFGITESDDLPCQLRKAWMLSTALWHVPGAVVLLSSVSSARGSTTQTGLQLSTGVLYLIAAGIALSARARRAAHEFIVLAHVTVVFVAAVLSFVAALAPQLIIVLPALAAVSTAGCLPGGPVTSAVSLAFTVAIAACAFIRPYPLPLSWPDGTASTFAADVIGYAAAASIFLWAMGWLVYCDACETRRKLSYSQDQVAEISRLVQRVTLRLTALDTEAVDKLLTERPVPPPRTSSVPPSTAAANAEPQSPLSDVDAGGGAALAAINLNVVPIDIVSAFNSLNDGVKRYRRHLPNYIMRAALREGDSGNSSDEELNISSAEQSLTGAIGGLHTGTTPPAAPTPQLIGGAIVGATPAVVSTHRAGGVVVPPPTSLIPSMMSFSQVTPVHSTPSGGPDSAVASISTMSNSMNVSATTPSAAHAHHSNPMNATASLAERVTPTKSRESSIGDNDQSVIDLNRTLSNQKVKRSGQHAHRGPVNIALGVQTRQAVCGPFFFTRANKLEFDEQACHRLLTFIHDAARQTSCSTHMFINDTMFVSFGATARTAQPEVKACRFINAVQKFTKEAASGYSFHCALTGGMMTCLFAGDDRQRTFVVTSTFQDKVAAAVPRARALRVPLVDHVVYETAKFHFVMRAVHILDEYPTQSTEEKLLYEIVKERSRDGAGDEWMYELEECETDPNMTVTQACAALCKGDALRAIALLDSIREPSVSQAPTVVALRQRCMASKGGLHTAQEHH